MFKRKNVLLAALWGSLCCFAPAGAAAPTTGMPNPMVAYDSVSAAQAEAGFTPLYLSSLSGYHLNQVWVIGGDIIDLEYVSDSRPTSSFRLRTARCTELMNEDISGIHGVKWEQTKVNGLPVAVTEMAGEKGMVYAAHWTYDNMLFSLSADNMTYREFWRLLEKGLVELTKAYF